MAKKTDDCPICGQYIDIAVSGFRDNAFITGKTYEYICFTCASVPKESFIIFPVEDDTKELLNSLEQMISDGFDKKRAEVSIKTIKKLIKKKK